MQMKFSLILLLGFFILLVFGESFAQQLNPGDGIRVTFLDISDKISGDYFVQPEGKLQLPYIGIINTTDRDFSIIKSQIISKYDSLYRNPEITVLALYRINIHGEVRNPGYYFVTETETLTGIIALAGGYTNAANLDNLLILRNDKEIELDIESIIEEGNTASDIGLQSGDQIVVPRSFWADPGRLSLVVSIIAALVTAVALFVR